MSISVIERASEGVNETVRENISERNESTIYEKKPFTVSAIFFNGSKVVIHTLAEDARSARDDALMQTGGAAFIVSIFEGHLVEAEVEVTPIHEKPTEIKKQSTEIETASSSSL